MILIVSDRDGAIAADVSITTIYFELMARRKLLKVVKYIGESKGENGRHQQYEDTIYLNYWSTTSYRKYFHHYIYNYDVNNIECTIFSFYQIRRWSINGISHLWYSSAVNLSNHIYVNRRVEFSDTFTIR